MPQAELVETGRAGVAPPAATTPPRPLAPARLWRRFFRDRLALVGLAIVTLFVALSVSAPLLAPYDPTAAHPARRLEGPSLAHPLGTDHLGRDVLSRLLFGARWSLGTAALAMGLVMTIGVSVGALSGYYGGVLDDLLMRVVDTLLAFPHLVLALAIVGTLGPGIVNVMIGLVAIWWVDYARIVRGLVLGIRERPYVEAARCVGASDRRVILRHILPNVLPPVVVLATLEMGSLILALSGLNFLGLGAQPPTPEWGAMLNDGRAFLLGAPQLMVYPGVAISLVVIGFNLLGDGLRDVLDPWSSAHR
jgi:peptide/nickel transport system permease protein